MHLRCLVILFVRQIESLWFLKHIVKLVYKLFTNPYAICRLWRNFIKYCPYDYWCAKRLYLWSITLHHMNDIREASKHFKAMMTSSNGDICAGNSPVPGEFPTQRPVTRSFDVFFDLRPNKRLSKQSWGWWFEMLSHPLRRHRNAIFCGRHKFPWLDHWRTSWLVSSYPKSLTKSPEQLAPRITSSNFYQQTLCLIL